MRCLILATLTLSVLEVILLLCALIDSDTLTRILLTPAVIAFTYLSTVCLSDLRDEFE